MKRWKIRNLAWTWVRRVEGIQGSIIIWEGERNLFFALSVYAIIWSTLHNFPWVSFFCGLYCFLRFYVHLIKGMVLWGKLFWNLQFEWCIFYLRSTVDRISAVFTKQPSAEVFLIYTYFHHYFCEVLENSCGTSAKESKFSKAVDVKTLEHRT